MGKDSFLKGVLGNFVEVTKDAPASKTISAPRAPAPSPAPQPDLEPEEIGSLMRSTASAATPPVKSSSRSAAPPAPAHPSRVPALVAQVQGRIPQDNALTKLAVLEQQLGAISDPETRRTTALGILGSQGITEETLAAARSSLESAISGYFDNLQQQAQSRLTAQIPQIRQQAAQARGQIETLKDQIDTLTAKAEDLEKSASDEEADLTDLMNEIESARTAALSTYCA